MTLVVNLYGGPGTGKSTTAALLFGKLKQAGINCELAHEYAKDLTWENRFEALAFQPYVCAKQMYRVQRLMGKVDVIVTDSPILLSLVYKGDGYTNAFGAYVLDQFLQWETINYVIVRDIDAHPYNPKGRNQTLFEAEQIDHKIKAMLETHGIQHIEYLMGESLADTLFDDVLTAV